MMADRATITPLTLRHRPTTRSLDSGSGEGHIVICAGLGARQAGGRGLVLVSGCGHPRTERILAVTGQVLDVPIRAVAGGLHLPVHPAGTPLIPQAVLGNPHPPWQPISERDAGHVLEQIAARGPRVIALSGHDSTPWTYDAFSRRFGDRYRTLRAGEELRITAADR
jgi:7,8-dihydropterin-6-yl-methyl-4-(beta-D-ribofuranosyl)aminobenzene 5'-phosphate synthase